MKESDIKKMSLAEINRTIGIYVQTSEFSTILNTDDVDFVQNFMNGVGNTENLYQYILTRINGDESKVDKLSIIIITLKNYLKHYNEIMFNIRNFEEEDIEDIRNGEELFKGYIEEAKKILRDIKKTIYILKFGGNGRGFIDTLDTQELVTGKRKNQNQSKLEELKERGLELEEIADAIVLTDLAEIICEPELGGLIRYLTFYNTGVQKGLIQTDSKTVITPEEHINSLRDEMSYEEMLPNVVQALEESIEYIDLDKLLLCSAYRYINFLETAVKIHEDDEVEVARRLKIIHTYLKGKNVKIQGKMEMLIYGDNEGYEYIDVSYRAKDLERDMQKYRGTKYFGKNIVGEIKTKLLSGEISFRDLEYKEIQLNTEEKIAIAVANDDNYLYLIESGLVDCKTINKINILRNSLPVECIQELQKQKILSEEEIIELYLQGKVDLDKLSLLDIDLKRKLKVEYVYFEFSKENNDERISRISELYKKTMYVQEDEEHKEVIYNAYLSSLDAKYLEIFLKLGTLKYEDLKGIMTAKEWTEALEGNEISEQFFYELQQNGIIAIEDIKDNKKLLLKQLKLWEAGIVPRNKIKELGVSIEELLRMCEKGTITGKKIYELLHTVEERDELRRKIKSNYVYGMFDTIKPGFVCYNNNLISRDNIISIAKDMKVKGQEIVDSCSQGLLSGEKIAELYYGHLISKQVFLKIKEMGLVSEKDEINVLNNLTPEEMISELEENGCTQVVDIEEIIRESTALKGRTKGNRDGTYGYRKQVINPMARNKLLELLGADKIVTTPEQGFKGYQVYLIPRLNIAVMEKMFRVNKDKEVKPSYGDATYVCELGKFLLVAGQSKQEIRAFMEVDGSSNGRVEIIEHRKNWGSKLVDAIAKINPEINISYSKNKQVQQLLKNDNEITIDVQKLNDLIEQIRQGDYSLNLEDYE